MKLPSSVYIAGSMAVFYLLGAAMIGAIAETSRIYHDWIWAGMGCVTLVTVWTSLSWIKRVKSPLRFIAVSLATSFVIFGLIWCISWLLPDAYVLQISDGKSTDADGNLVAPAGTVLDMENYGAAAPVTVVGSCGIGATAALSIFFSLYRMRTLKRKG